MANAFKTCQDPAWQVAGLQSKKLTNEPELVSLRPATPYSATTVRFATLRRASLVCKGQVLTVQGTTIPINIQ
jgi:hypothetical protein